MGTWIDNNTDLLLGFSLQIPEKVLAGPDLQGKVPSLNINPTLAFQKVGDIASEAQILDGEDSGFFHFPYVSTEGSSSVLTSPLVRAALLNEQAPWPSAATSRFCYARAH